ncbi:ABC transporter permease [Chloroflexia bacterium SDU3-3]|nr:ABC transporter permease [Chloroflexia bacterium SDU3-3]
MIGYLFRRLLATAGVLLGISALAFGLSALAPGDPAEILLVMRMEGSTPSKAAIESFRHELGLSQPAPLRYTRWLARTAQGDLGTSYRSGRPVAAEIAARLPATLALAASSMALAALVGVPLGVLAAIQRGGVIDRAGLALATLGASMPSYLLALLLVLLFAAALGWLPAFGYGTPRHMVLPSVALAAGVATTVLRLVRASMLEALRQDYVRLARAKGLAEWRVVGGHVLRNAAAPIITALAMSAGRLLSGAVVVERIFAWPGVGRYAVDAISARDYPVIQGVMVYMAAIFALVNLLADLLCGWLDPRITDRQA